MIIDVFKQSYDEVIYKTNLTDDIPMFFDIECRDCSGTGVFYITTEDSQSCVQCKGKGVETVTVY